MAEALWALMHINEIPRQPWSRSKTELLVFTTENFQSILLPPANEVWSKVMFLHLSVSHSVHGGAMHARQWGHV